MNDLIIPSSNHIQCTLIQPAFVKESGWAAFGEHFGVEFSPSPGPGVTPHTSRVLICENVEEVIKSCGPARTFVAPEVASTRGEDIDSIEICGEIPGKAWLRGQLLNLQKTMRVEPIPLRIGVEVMARCKAGPVWVREVVGGAVIDRVALPLPESAATPNSSVFDWLNSETFPQLLPFIQFLREVTGEHRWHFQPKACFMFDDPNLHAQSYGFIDYRKLIAQAVRHRYHVSFATVPLDGWFVSTKAAMLFRDSKAQLSLLVHGNDHVHHELARAYSREQREALLRQALRRIRQMEMKAAVEVCRVMAAPHGACNEDMLRDMARFGFEAACISHGSLRYHNRERAWTRGLGSRPAVIVEGLPVFPRFPMTAANARQNALLAAYMDQPIVPMGHHGDVASDLELLNGLADHINRIGSVQWVRMSEVARTHFQWRTEAETVVVRRFSRLTRLIVPEDVTCLRVDPLPGGDIAQTSYSIEGARLSKRDCRPGDVVRVVPGEAVWLGPSRSEYLNLETGMIPSFKFWPVARRVAGEVRDRIKPWLC